MICGDFMEYAFPVNGVQRDTCERCLFFGGNFDRQLRTTICRFPVGVPFEEQIMIPYSFDEETLNPAWRALRLSRCPCFVDKNIAIDACRVEIKRQLEVV